MNDDKLKNNDNDLNEALKDLLGEDSDFDKLMLDNEAVTDEITPSPIVVGDEISKSSPVIDPDSDDDIPHVSSDELAEILRELGVDDFDPIVSSLKDDESPSSEESAPTPQITPDIESAFDDFSDLEDELEEIEKIAAVVINEDTAAPVFPTETTHVARTKAPAKKPSKINRFATKKVAAILLGLISITSLVGLYLVFFFTNEEIVYLVSDEIPITVVQNPTGLNNANFIFVSQARGEVNEIFLSRMLIDSMATVFMFDRAINWNEFTVNLRDDRFREYGLALSFYGNMERDRLIFEPIHTDARGLLLTMTHNPTGEFIQFPLEFGSSIIVMPTMHIINRSFNQMGDTSFVITGGNFSPSGSSIFYTQHSVINSLTFDNILLIHGATVLPAKSIMAFDLDHEGNSVLGRVDFEALPSVAGNATLRFTNAFSSFYVNQGFPVGGLFRNTIDDQVQINIGGNTLVLERLGRRSRDFVMVLHGANPDGQRIETRIDAVLRVTDNLGMTHNLYPRTFSGPMGTDLLFDITEALGVGSAYVLYIEKAHFGGVDFDINISLDALVGSRMRFTDEIVVDLAVEYLMNMGYERTEIVSYMFEDQDFASVFHALRQGEVFTYLVRGSRAEFGWDFDMQRVGVHLGQAGG